MGEQTQRVAQRRDDEGRGTEKEEKYADEDALDRARARATSLSARHRERSITT